MRLRRTVWTVVLGLATALTVSAAMPQAVLAWPVIYIDADATGSDDGTSWNDAFTDLQDGLAAAVTGNEIWVAAGTYTPTIPAGYEATFQLINGVGLYGGFIGSETKRDQRDWESNVTALSGDTDGNGHADSDHVVTGSGTDGSAILDGFTVTKGNASGAEPYESGGGMYNYQGNPTVRNVIFKQNRSGTSDGIGGGGGMYNHQSSPTLVNVTFISNSVYSAYAFSPGGGMYNYQSNPKLINCSFRGNYAGGRYGAGDGGGMYNHQSSPVVVNTTFHRNHTSSWSSTYGGGMYNGDGSSPILVNCVFSRNYCGSLYYLAYGGGMYNRESTPILVNCILWGNTIWGINITDYGSQIYGSASVTYSIVQSASLYAAGGNLNDDPQFVDASGGDLRVLPTSPAIDSGNNNAVWPDIADLDGDANVSEPTPLDLDNTHRFIDMLNATDTGNGTPPLVDMGAYEYHSLTLSKTAEDLNGWPLFANDLIRYEISTTNLATNVMGGIVVTDTLPVTGVTFLSAQPAYSGTNPIIWDIGDLSAGDSWSATITLQVDGTASPIEGNLVQMASSLQGRTDVDPVFPYGGGAVYERSGHLLMILKRYNPSS